MTLEIYPSISIKKEGNFTSKDYGWWCSRTRYKSQEERLRKNLCKPNFNKIHCAENFK